MSSGALIAIIAIAFVVAIALNIKTKVNLGLWALVFAFVIGVFLMGMKVKDVAALFPSKVFFQVMLIMLFFGFAAQNGTMIVVAKWILYACRKVKWSIPYAIFFAGFAITLMGGAPPVAAVLVCVVGFGIAVHVGYSPYMIAPFIAYGGMAGSFVRWGASGALVEGFLVTSPYADQAAGITNHVLLMFTITTLVVCTIFYVIFKGWRMENAPIIEKPEAMTKAQKQTLVIIIVAAVFLIVPAIIARFVPALKTFAGFCDIQVISAFGAVICLLLKVGDGKEVINKWVPWNVLIMLAGIYILLNLAQKAGAVDLASAWISGSLPAGAIAPAFVVIGGIMSLFSGAVTVVWPMLATIVAPVAASTGLSAALLYSSILIGGSVTSISPFSTGGSLLLAQSGEFGYDGTKMTICLILQAIVGLGVTLLFSAIGLYA